MKLLRIYEQVIKKIALSDREKINYKFLKAKDINEYVKIWYDLFKENDTDKKGYIEINYNKNKDDFDRFVYGFKDYESNYKTVYFEDITRQEFKTKDFYVVIIYAYKAKDTATYIYPR